VASIGDFRTCESGAQAGVDRLNAELLAGMLDDLVGFWRLRIARGLRIGRNGERPELPHREKTIAAGRATIRAKTEHAPKPYDRAISMLG